MEVFFLVAVSGTFHTGDASVSSHLESSDSETNHAETSQAETSDVEETIEETTSVPSNATDN